MRSRLERRHSALVLAPVLILIALQAAGCGQRLTSEPDSLEPESSAGTLLAPAPTGGPAGAGGRGAEILHMPLAVGNRWDYLITYRSVIVSPGNPGEIMETVVPLRVEITDRQPIEGHEYFVQSEFNPISRDRAVASQYWYRQDRSGLYNLDLVRSAGVDAVAQAPGEALTAQLASLVSRLPAGSPQRAAYAAAAARLGERIAVLRLSGPSRAFPTPPANPGPATKGGYRLGGPLPGEITMLRYPLFTGARWIVRDSPRFAREVVGRGRTTVPAGEFAVWQVLGTSELFGPRDRVEFLHARQGLIRLKAQFVSEATDEQGNPIGTLISGWEQSLTDLSLHSSVQ